MGHETTCCLATGFNLRNMSLDDFFHCVSILYYTYTRRDGIAYYTPKLCMWQDAYMYMCVYMWAYARWMYAIVYCFKGNVE